MDDVFSINKKISKIEKLLETASSSEKVKLEKQLKKLKAEDKDMTDKIVNDVANAWLNKEKAFNERDYSEQSDSYYLIKYAVDRFLKGDATCFNTDDIQYGAWENIVPEVWQKNALKLKSDKKESLNKYFEVMGYLEDLFSHLAYFNEDISNYFPEERIIIRTPVIDNKQYLIDMDLIIGQGSDFSISVVEGNKPELYEEHPIRFIIDWGDAIKVAKMNVHDQAAWYADNGIYAIRKDNFGNISKVNLVTPENREKVLSILDNTLKTNIGFYNCLNDKNFDKVINSSKEK